MTAFGCARALVVLAAAPLWAAPASAREPPRVAGFALPSRHPDARLLETRACRVAELLARRLSGRYVDATTVGTPLEGDLGGVLARARRLEAEGALDEAAATYDVVLKRATRSLHRVSDPAGLVTAWVARASIAVARGEVDQARAVLARLRRYDAGFALRLAEDRPSMRAIVAAVDRGRGPRRPLGEEDLGEICERGPDVLVVGPRLERGAAELVRLDRCREVSHHVVTPAAA